MSLFRTLFRLKIARQPAYSDLLALGRQRTNPIFLDLACCCWCYISTVPHLNILTLIELHLVGNDSRKVIQDGYPLACVLASDLHEGFSIYDPESQPRYTHLCLDFWQLGHEMFRSSQQTFPVPFIQGDILDQSFLDVTVPFRKGNLPTTSTPALNTVTSLNPLRGHVSACFCGAFFHLFGEEEQSTIAAKLAGLLSPEPGSMIFGVHGGRKQKGVWHPTGSERYMFCHSPESWKDLWEGLLGVGEVEVKAHVKLDIGGDDFFGTYPGNKYPYHIMQWSVTRL